MKPLDEFKSEAYRDGYRSGYAAGVSATFNPSLRWVSVKDRLPDKEGYYLCTFVFDFHRFYQDKWFNGKEFSTTDNITHWMPLPNLPEENNK